MPGQDTGAPQNPDDPKAQIPGTGDAPGMSPDAQDDPNQPPGMQGGIAETTKPRQLPEGGDPGMDGMDGGLTDQFDPDLNGGDIEQGADSTPPGADDSDSSDDTHTEASLRTRARKQRDIADEVRRHNPTLAAWQCYKIAEHVYDTYLVRQGADVNPLLYGDRGSVGDGPLSGPLKHWSPADIKPPKPSPRTPDSGNPDPDGTFDEPPATQHADDFAEPAASAGETAEAAESAAKILPLLAL